MTLEQRKQQDEDYVYWYALPHMTQRLVRVVSRNECEVTFETVRDLVQGKADAIRFNQYAEPIPKRRIEGYGKFEVVA